MRHLFVFIAIVCASTCATAQDSARQVPTREQCLSGAEQRHEVAQKVVVAPAVAIKAARAVVNGGRIIRASLCRLDGELVYRVTVLHRDGRVSRVTVDGRSGRLEPQN